jgi:hypothetical protein
MRYGVWLFLVSLLILEGQAVVPQNGPKTPESPTVEKAALALDTPIITIAGLCDNDLLAGDLISLLSRSSAVSAPAKRIDSACKTVITRRQYEQALAAAGGKAKSSSQSKFARQYIDKLMFASEALENGGDKDPIIEARVRYAYLQSLELAALIQMQRQANDVTEADAEKYFQQHPERFVRMHLQQISVPKNIAHDDDATPGKEAPPTKPAPAEQEKMHQLALRIQKEAAAGGNIEKLEERAYKTAHDPSVPEIDLGEPLPEEVPPEFRKLIFDLQPGQVSAVVENDHEYLIYKCAGRHTVPRAEVKRLYGWLRMRDAKQALQDRIQPELNPQYFDVSPSNNQ